MFNKFIPIIIAAASFIIWEAVIADPKNFWYSLAVFLVVFVSGFLKLHGFKTAHKKEAWLLAAPPFFLAAFAGVMLLFLNVPWVAHALTFAVAAAVYIYLARIYTFLFAITRYQPLALERLSSFMAVASFAFAGIAAYGCMNFLNASLWQTALAVAAVSFVLTYQFLWVNKIDEQQNVFASLLVTILLVEFFWAISFFPVVIDLKAIDISGRLVPIDNPKRPNMKVEIPRLLAKITVLSTRIELDIKTIYAPTTILKKSLKTISLLNILINFKLMQEQNRFHQNQSWDLK